MAGPRDWVFRARQQSLQGARKKGDQDGYKEKLAKGKKAPAVKSLSLRVGAGR